MKINLISQEDYSKLLEIYKCERMFFLQNNGYEYIKKSDFSKEQWNKIQVIESILKKAIIGFASFSNFRLDIGNRPQIRIQYNYGAEDNTTQFIGVGYVLIDELLNGFNK